MGRIRMPNRRGWNRRGDIVYLLFAVAATFLLITAPAFGQRSAAVEGVISNDVGEPLPDARIQIRGGRLMTRSQPDGSYRLEPLVPGTYRVIVQAEGYAPRTREIRVGAGDTAALNVGLEPSVFELPSIVTTGAAVETDVQNAAGDIEAIAGREKRRRQTGSLGATLDELAGVSNIATGSQTGKPVIRGLSGNRIRVLKDGIGVNYQQFGVRHPPNIDPFLADRIEVVRGASSVLYGSDAIGGAVNVLPVPIPFTREGRTAVDGRLQTHYASVNEERTGALRVNAGRGGFGLTAAWLVRDGRDVEVPDIRTFPETGEPGRPNFTGELDHTDFRQVNGEIGIGYRGDFGDVSLRYDTWDSEQNFLLPPPQNLPDGLGIGLNLENETVQAEANLELNPLWQLRTQFSAVENLREANPAAIGDPERPRGSTRAFLPEDIVIDIERDTYTGRVEAQHLEIGPGFVGRIGAEVVREQQNSRGSSALTPGGDIESIAVFAFENIHFGPLHVELGARYDHREQEADPDKTFDDSVIPEDVSLREQSYDVFTGSVGVNYHVSDDLAVVANIGRGFRAPTLFELFVNGVHGGVAAIQRGDPNLDEETSLSTDFGVRWRTSRIEFKANVYRNAISDYIFLSDTGEQNPAELPIFQVDQDDAVLVGGDVSLWARLTDRFDVRATFETVDGEFDASNDDLPLLPADQFQLRGRWRAGDWGPFQDVRFSAGLRYAADKDAAGLREPFGQFDRIPFGTASTEDYTLIDLGLAFDVPLGQADLEIDVGIDNLTDQAYRDFLDTYKGYALSPGRNVWLKASVPFSLQ